MSQSEAAPVKAGGVAWKRLRLSKTTPLPNAGLLSKGPRLSCLSKITTSTGSTTYLSWVLVQFRNSFAWLSSATASHLLVPAYLLSLEKRGLGWVAGMESLRYVLFICSRLATMAGLRLP